MTDATPSNTQAAAPRARGRGRPRANPDASQTTASSGPTAASRNGARQARPAKLGALIQSLDERVQREFKNMKEHIRGIEHRLSS